MDSLCCCEYLDTDGERNHLLACCCNCQDLDQGFEGLISGKDVPLKTKENILKTIQDRIRIPWIGGAIQIPLDVALPSLTVPFLLLLATINVQFAIISCIIFLLFLLAIYKYFIDSVPNFFISLTIISLLILYVIFEVLVVSFLQILLEENIALSIITLGFMLCMHITKRKIIKSKEPLLTTEKRKSSYCSKCQIYRVEENQHHYWIDCCVTKTNQWYYFFGLICAFAALIYSSNLTLTSICKPYKLYKTILLPQDCSEVYEMMELSLSFSSALYSCLLAAFILWKLFTHTFRIICGSTKLCQHTSKWKPLHWIRSICGYFNRIVHNAQI